MVMLDAADLSALPADFEEYRIVRPLGRGAMGEVFLAHDTALDRPVAVKLVSHLEPDARTRERFFLEARALARVRHPNVVAIHRVGEVRGRPYLVSEYVAGRSLDALDRPVPAETLLAVARGLAAGLSAAHRQGVLHRDIKPANALLTPEGSVKLIDFGLAERMAEAPETSLPGPAWEAQRGIRARDDEGATASLPSAPTDPDGGPAGKPTVSAETTEPRPAAVRAPSARSAGLPRRRVAGTPLYMAPELWTGAPASPRTDLYALGALLYELATGAAPHAGVPYPELPSAARSRDVPRIAAAAPSLDPRLAAAIDRCLDRSPGARFPSAEALRSALDALDEPDRAVFEGCPYRGLLAFEAAHSAVFCGRSAEARAIFDRLRSEALVVVTGDSGSGKSSVCRAGVIPMVEREGLGGGAAWRAVTLVPGSHPIAALASALARRIGAAEEDLIAAIRADPFELGRRLRDRPGSEGAPLEGTLVLVDQLEEVMSLSDPAETALAGAALAGIALLSPTVRLLTTVRSDFLTRLTALPRFGRLAARSIYLLPAMDAEDIERAIVDPAAQAGVRFESEEAVRELTRAALGAPSGLPLLQFALAELWDLRDRARGVVPTSALGAIGGMEGALARHADGVVEALPPDQRKEAQRALLGLVTADGTRARRSFEDLAGGEGDASGAAMRAALDALVRGRLLVARASDDHTTAFEISHEALIARWETLRGWIRRDADLLALRHRVERAAADWERLGRHRGVLWSPVQLAEVAALGAEAIGPRERAFLAASRRAARWAQWAWALAAGAAALLGAGAYGVARAREAAELGRHVRVHLQAADAAENRARALAVEAAEGRKEALATYRREGWKQGEAASAAAHQRALQADEAYAEAVRALENALGLDDRVAYRTRAADILLARFFAAEADGRKADLEILRRHLGLFDRDGSRAASLAAGGSVAVRSSVPATVSLSRYDTHERVYSVGARRDLGPTPTAAIALDQGSYLAELSAPGRITVRAPFVVGRAESVALDVDLPPQGSVPESFAFVPAGAFLFGCGDAYPTRVERYNSLPIHRAETGAYLIARHEVTFGEWIRYLEALPEDQRKQATPHGRDERDELTLSPIGPGRWRLTFDDGRVRYTAATGEPFVGRNGRKGAWERFPVVGISQGDAVLYAEWLDKTGLIRGARLCREDEWERAGRGADGRRYPMGDQITFEMANISPMAGLDPDGFDPREVGSYPASRSPFGIDDMSGNAMEVTRSVLGDEVFSNRSGSWGQGIWHSRMDYRGSTDQTLRHPRIGFRLCASWP